jgi:hypothetical protein
MLTFPKWWRLTFPNWWWLMFPNLRRRPCRVGVMTCALGEVACAAFTVGALVDLVNCYVFVDTGSTDGTPELIEHLYSREIEAARLIVERLGKLIGYDMSVAPRRALELLRAVDVASFLKFDADVVFYDAGARKIVEITPHPAACRHLGVMPGT